MLNVCLAFKANTLHCIPNIAAERRRNIELDSVRYTPNRSRHVSLAPMFVGEGEFVGENYSKR